MGNQAKGWLVVLKTSSSSCVANTQGTGFFTHRPQPTHRGARSFFITTLNIRTCVPRKVCNEDPGKCNERRENPGAEAQMAPAPATRPRSLPPGRRQGRGGAQGRGTRAKSLKQTSGSCLALSSCHSCRAQRLRKPVSCVLHLQATQLQAARRHLVRGCVQLVELDTLYLLGEVVEVERTVLAALATSSASTAACHPECASCRSSAR